MGHCKLFGAHSRPVVLVGQAYNEDASAFMESSPHQKPGSESASSLKECQPPTRDGIAAIRVEVAMVVRAEDLTIAQLTGPGSKTLKICHTYQPI